MSEMEEEAVAGMHTNILEEDANSLLESTANDSLLNDETDEIHENGQECCDETDGSDAKSTNSLGFNELSREMMEDIIGVIGGNKKSPNEYEYAVNKENVTVTPVTTNNTANLTTTNVVTTTIADTTTTDTVPMETKPNSDELVKSESKKRKNRELNSILALSKEARLDTNIAHKRNNTRNSTSSPSLRVNSPTVAQNQESVASVSAPATPANPVKYPVTAEAELDISPSFNNLDSHDIDSNDVDGVSTASSAATAPSSEKKSKRSNLPEDVPMFKPGKDMFCWRCHREGVNIACETCPRSYHQKCLKQTAISDTDHWPCPECVEILKAESTETRSEAMKNMTLEHLCSLLKFACNRMMQCQGAEPFIHPVNETDLPDYKKYIINPMNLTLMERNIKDNLYGSTQAFEADAKWILHNSIVYNSFHSKLTTAARGIVKICKQEMAEIENCPSCYLNANTKKNTWFVEVCPKPHLLVWAKLKGFPYWPAKAMCSNSQGMVDVRFFGAHDRAWVPLRECYVYSVKDPNSYKQKRYDIEKCIKELNVYVENLKKIYGEVKFAPYKTLYDPENEEKQLQQMLPQYRSNQKMKLTKVDYSKHDRKPVSSKKNPDDTMEGYGTDDDDEDNDSDLEINNLRRKLLMKKSGNKDDEGENNVMESEADDDATNLNTFAGKLNLTPKSVPATTGSKRRRGSDDDGLHSPPPMRKLRRNSDHSIKSDSSSRMSSVSSSKTEEGDGSPNSKMKITDKLIKRLSDGEKTEKDKNDGNSVENASKPEEVQKKEPATEKVEVKKDDKPVEEIAKVQVTEKKNELSVKVPEKQDKQDNLCSLQEKFNNSEITLEKIPKGNDTNSSTAAKRRIIEQEPTKLIKLVKKKAPTPTPAKEPPTEMICQPDIKIEPEDEEEYGIEYMEAKRQYLSALNISEKSKNTSAMNNNTSGGDKMNEIRTRSKTEERKNDNRRRTIGQASTPPIQRPPSAKSDISVKQFAKIVSMTAAAANNNNQNNQRARKSFPTPNYLINKSVAPPSSNTNSTVVMVTSKSGTPVPPLTTISGLPSLEPIRPNSLVVLAPSQFLSNSGGPQSFILPPLVASSSNTSNASVTTAATSTTTVTTPLNVRHSQNYIPQNELDAIEDNENAAAPSSSSGSANSTFSLNNLRTMVFSANNNANNNNVSNSSNSNGGTANAAPPAVDLAVAATSSSQNDDLSVLHSLLPENLGRAVSELLCRPPPKLHKRPPGPLSGMFDSGTPSSAGPISNRINSMAHRLTDYFRGMLIETLEDIGKTDCSEAIVANLQREIETLKHKHEMEIVEIRKNVCTVLKDIQKCVLEEREKIVDQTRAACEAEALKRIEEAKSKQWCANCSKEAQFYCCWNTSYCDYPCQQKHWPSHMSKCTQSQNANQSNPIRATSAGGQQIVLRPANPPPKGSNFPVNRIIAAKPAKIFRSNAPPPPKSGFKVQAANAASHLTLVESTPGNYELVSNGALSGKILATTNTVMNKIKSSSSASPISATGGSTSTAKTKTVNILEKPKDNVTVLDDSD